MTSSKLDHDASICHADYSWKHFSESKQNSTRIQIGLAPLGQKKPQDIPVLNHPGHHSIMK